MTENTSPHVLQGHERFNVDVPSGKQKFLQHFYDLIKEKKFKSNLIDDKQEEPEFMIDEEKVDDEAYDRSRMELLVNSDKDGANVKDKMQTRIDQIDLTIEPVRKPCFYHYKRWLWVMFPWVCMSIHKQQTFSEFINKCYSSNIRYLSVEEENQYTKHAIRIVIDANKKKQLSLGKKEEDINKTSRATITSKQQLRTVHSEVKPKGFLLQNLPGSRKNTMGNFKSIRTLKPMDRKLSTLENEKSEPQKTVSRLPKTSMVLNRHTNNNSVFQNQTAKDSNLFFTDIQSDASQMKEKRQRMTNRDFPSQISAISNVNGSNLNGEREEDRVSQILKKNEFWDNRIKANTYHKDVSKILSQNMSQTGGQTETNMILTLPKVTEALNNYQTKEVRALERKNQMQILDFNKTINDSRLKMKIIDKLAKTEFDLIGPDPNIDVKMKNDLGDLSTELLDTERKLGKSIEQKCRMTRVIEICEINQIQNEEWIRGLNFYLSNLKKVINGEKTEYKDEEKAQHDYDALAKAFINDFNHGVEYHSLYLNNIRNYLSNQSEIDMKVKSTDDLIYASVDAKKQEVYQEYMLNMRKEKIEQEKILKEKRKYQVQNELEELKRKYEEVKCILEPDAEDLIITEEAQSEEDSNFEDSNHENTEKKSITKTVSWYETLKFKKMLENFDTRKDLLRHTHDLESKRQDLQRELEYQETIQETYNNAIDYGQEAKPDSDLLNTKYTNEIERMQKELILYKKKIENRQKEQTHIRECSVQWDRFMNALKSHIWPGGVTKEQISKTSFLGENTFEDNLKQIMEEGMAKKKQEEEMSKKKQEEEMAEKTKQEEEMAGETQQENPEIVGKTQQEDPEIDEEKPQVDQTQFKKFIEFTKEQINSHMNKIAKNSENEDLEGFYRGELEMENKVQSQVEMPDLLCAIEFPGDTCYWEDQIL